MTADQFAQVVRTAEGYWPNKPFPDDTLDVWWSQMQAWQFDLVMFALPKLAREFHWLPSFAQLSQQYAIEVRLAEPAEKRSGVRHLSAISDPETRARWDRVIRRQLASPALGTFDRDDSPIARAVRPHYRRDQTGLVILDGRKMLASAEEAINDQ